MKLVPFESLGAVSYVDLFFLFCATESTTSVTTPDRPATERVISKKGKRQVD